MVGITAACAEQSPTRVGGENPVEVRTFEIELPWSEFGGGVGVFGGFGRAVDIGAPLLADQYRGLVDSRAVVRFPPLPFSATVRDSSGTLVIDTLVEIVAARIDVDLDSLRIDSLLDYDLRVGRVEQEWDVGSANWEFAVDTGGVQIPWEEPGAGPTVPIGDARKEAGVGSTVTVELDSATLVAWDDSLSQRTARFDLDTPGERIRIIDVNLRVDVRSSIVDTVVTLNFNGRDRTFLYTPEPPAVEGGFRIGGAPSFRSVIDLDVPSALNGPPEFCAVVGCPFTLTPDVLSRATLILTSRATEPAAFQPLDSVTIDVRPVLAPEVLPKSPLGTPLAANSRFGAEDFGADAGRELGIPLTNFIASLVDPEGDPDAPASIALLTLFEPLDIAFFGFEGPGDPGEPVLRLLLTVADTVTFR
jgi:hypothetical protein